MLPSIHTGAVAPEESLFNQAFFFDEGSPVHNTKGSGDGGTHTLDYKEEEAFFAITCKDLGNFRLPFRAGMPCRACTRERVCDLRNVLNQVFVEGSYDVLPTLSSWLEAAPV